MEFPARLTGRFLKIWPRMWWGCWGLIGLSFFSFSENVFSSYFFPHICSMKYCGDLRSKEKKSPLTLFIAGNHQKSAHGNFGLRRNHFLLYKWSEKWQGKCCSKNNCAVYPISLDPIFLTAPSSFRSLVVGLSVRL